MIRVVLDSNVLVSGIPALSGTLAEVIDHWRVGSYELVISEHILTEVGRAWQKPYWSSRLPLHLATASLELLATNSDVVSNTTPVEGVATHPEDDLVLGVVIGSATDYLVTGDKAPQSIGQFEGIIDLSPQECIGILTHRDWDSL